MRNAAETPATSPPNAFEHVARSYRTFDPGAGRRVPFHVKVETTDLYLLAESDLSDEAQAAVRTARATLEEHIRARPAFATSLRPLDPPAGALSPLLREMYEAARAADVGPMAAVAGAVAQAVGRALRRHAAEIVVENGGDLYLELQGEATVGVFAGSSPFSGCLGLRVVPQATPLGLCTSSRTVGPSLSFGCADAATILAHDAALADAVATGVGNRVQGPADLEAAVDWALGIPGVLGAIAVLGDRLAVRGDVEFVRISC